MFERFITTLATDMKELKVCAAVARDETQILRTEVIQAKAELQKYADLHTDLVRRIDRCLSGQSELHMWQITAELRLNTVELSREETSKAFRRMVFSIMSAVAIATLLGAMALWKQTL